MVRIDDIHIAVSLNKSDKRKLKVSGKSVRGCVRICTAPLSASTDGPAGRCERER
jgi:cephalosporin-C deacetylase-like acetyl esterase